MGNYTHETVPTQFVEAIDVRYAYRRFGKPGTVPLLFLEYFNRWQAPLAPDSLLMSSGSTSLKEEEMRKRP